MKARELRPEQKPIGESMPDAGEPWPHGCIYPGSCYYRWRDDPAGPMECHTPGGCEYMHQAGEPLPTMHRIACDVRVACHNREDLTGECKTKYYCPYQTVEFIRPGGEGRPTNRRDQEAAGVQPAAPLGSELEGGQK